ncbi:uncharacterized protein LOC114747876 [Neltuma alba]|uniref:uncharacterized protein LOC114747876 n=1 Tax=Neltuma alba TaxID=207710 RepID=UPI0010A37AB2|nr:uncharacterized protein LOC114747876 [Prosopis alba]
MHEYASEVVNKAIRYFMEDAASGRYKHKIYQVPEREECKWKRPTKGCIHMDVDGSVNRRRNAACGGLIKNAQGKWVSGFQQNLGYLSSTIAELQAIRIGLQGVKQLRFKKVQLFTYPIEAIQLLMNDSGISHPVRDEIDETRLLIFPDWDLDIS